MSPLALLLAATQATTPMCRSPWNSELTSLTYVSPRGPQVALCVSAADSPNHPVDWYAACATVHLDGGAVEELPLVKFTPWPRPPGDKLFRDARASAESIETDVNATGTRGVAVVNGKRLALFDPRTGAVLETPKVTDAEHPIVTEASFIGDALYVVTEDANFTDRVERLIVRNKLTRVQWFDDSDAVSSSRPRVHLGGSLWAVASLRPHRVLVIDAYRSTLVWSVNLNELDFDAASRKDPAHRLRLGSSVAGTINFETSPLVRMKDGRLLLVSTLGLAVVDPTTRVATTTLYQPCE